MADETLARVLSALGHDTSSEAQITLELEKITSREDELPPMLVADLGAIITLPFVPDMAVAQSEDGATQTLQHDGARLTVPSAPGYYKLVLGSRECTLAVAPGRCPALPDKGHKGRKPWGVAVQIPALLGHQERAFGNLSELAQLADVLGKAGADALAINPLHALFPGHGRNFSPYSPSSRLFFNSAMGDPALAGLPPLPSESVTPLIDWETALPRRLAQLRQTFAALGPAERTQIAEEARSDGAMMRRHAVFDALDCHFRAQGLHGWRAWPAAFHDPASPAVARFAHENADEIAFHMFLQWLARTSLAAAQDSACKAGMSIGLIGDLAVGVDPLGSDCWSFGKGMLQGLTIGAPPDPLGPQGQNWSITSFSPAGLRDAGYTPFIAMLRSAFASCGALRIDHAFGLQRLWVIPEGQTSGDGVYLAFPFDDLIRLAKLEAYRANAFIIAEDLGTAPPGFTHAITLHHMLGMRVLWFERAADHGFIGAQDYPADSVAMTGTHDTATIAGWWSGRDLEWAEKLGRLPAGMSRADAESIRDWDRGLLWSTIGDGAPRPAPEAPEAVVDAAMAHIGKTAAALAITPLEDLLALTEQPNLPGTVTQHPNWRRRLDFPIAKMLEIAGVADRIAILNAARSRN